MSPALAPVLNATAIILIVLGLVALIVSLIPATSTRIPHLFTGAVTMLCIGLAFGVVLYVLESAY